jgi:hypothetical protein
MGAYEESSADENITPFRRADYQPGAARPLHQVPPPLLPS